MISWIPQKTLDAHIDTLLQRASDAKTNAPRRKRANVTDPFASLVVASTFGVSDSEELSEMQSFESTVRGTSNALGEFHQSILGSVPGWDNHDSGYDLECQSRKILAEVKNKHNTMNASNRRVVVAELDTAIRQKRGNWEAYLVVVVPKSAERYKKTLAPRSYEVDGASFYELVTGETNALHSLFDYMLDRKCESESVADYCRAALAQSLPPRLPLEVQVHL